MKTVEQITKELEGLKTQVKELNKLKGEAIAREGITAYSYNSQEIESDIGQGQLQFDLTDLLADIYEIEDIDKVYKVQIKLVEITTKEKELIEKHKQMLKDEEEKGG